MFKCVFFFKKTQYTHSEFKACNILKSLKDKNIITFCFIYILLNVPYSLEMGLYVQ